MKGEKVSIIIPVKNAEKYIGEQLGAIFSQEGFAQPEVIIIDSGSTDETRRIAGGFPVTIVDIPPEEFNHGGTRNLGAKKSTGDYLVYLTQDATPADKGWLKNLLAPFSELQGVAGVFSRHIPRRGCSIPLARQIEEEWPQAGGMERVVKRAESREALLANKPYYVYFANTSSCLLKSVWKKIPFGELDFGEDVDWAERALLAGYAIVYEPRSAVRHSHDYTLREQLRQHYDYGRMVKSARLAPTITIGSSIKTFSGSLLSDWRYLGRRGYARFRILGSVPYHLACVVGRWLGEHSERLPGRLRHSLSRQSQIKLASRQ